MLLRPAPISISLSPPVSTLRLTPAATQCAILRARGRHFSHTTKLLSHDDPQNHYEVLEISPNATHAELKKQFYVLSKETHPDVNPKDPNAGKRFAQISESYSVLADPEKRKRYDRDVMRQYHASRSHHGSRSSHHRGTYAGHRPPSGLSKRRSAFKGPPPSFHAHGNPSANTAKQAGGSHPQPNMAGTFNASAYTARGQWDPVFDASKVYRTQTHEDARRENRRAAALAEAQAEVEDDSNFWGRFIIVTGIIVLGVSLASLIAGMGKTPKGGLTRGDGSRRDGARNEWTKG